MLRLITYWILSSLGSLRARADREVSHHQRVNAEYRAMAPRWWHRWTYAPNAPGPYALQIVAAVVIFLAALWLGFASLPWLRDAMVSDWHETHAALWELLTAQVTVAALTYPIVLGLISVFVTRGRSSARLDAYLRHSGAVFSGLNAFFLAALLALHLAILDEVPPVITRFATFLYLFWLMGNLTVIALFLHRTVLFLRPATRERVYLQYALFHIWPRQLARLLAVTYSFSLLSSKLKNRNGEDVEVTVSPFSADDEKPVLEQAATEPIRLVDVWTHPLRWSLKRWVSRLPSIPGRRRGGSTNARISLPCILDSEYEPPVTIIRARPIDDTGAETRMSALERSFAKQSLRWRLAHIETTEQSVVELFVDLLREAHVAMSERQINDFEDALRTVIVFHGRFLSANDFKVGDNWDNYALISRGFSVRSIDDEIHRAYVDLIDKSTDLLDSNDRYFQTICYLGPKLLDSYASLNQPRIVANGVRLWKLAGMKLDQWWLHHIDDAGSQKHNAWTAARLAPPLRAAHERALRYHVGAHGNLIFRLTNKPDESGAWSEAPARFQRLINDLHAITELFMQEVNIGDDLSSIWRCDLIERWQNEVSGHGRDGPWYLDINRLPKLDSLQQSWEVVRRELEGDPDLGSSEASAKHLEELLIRRYWGDVIATVVAVLVDWGKGSADAAPLCLVLAKNLLCFDGHPQGGSLIGAEAPVGTLPDFFRSWLRIQILEHSGDGSTGNFLDTLLNEIAQIREGPRVSGQVYTSEHLSLFDLLSAQLSILVALASTPAGAFLPGDTATHFLRVALGDITLGEHAESRLRQAVEQLATIESTQLIAVTRGLTGETRDVAQIEVSRQAIHDRLESLRASLRQGNDDRVMSAPISESRVRKYAEIADDVFNAYRKLSPLFQKITTIERDPTLNRAFSIRIQVARADLTDPPLTTTFDRDLSHLRRQLDDYLSARSAYIFRTAADAEILVVHTEAEFERVLAEAVRRVRENGEHPQVFTTSRPGTRYMREWLGGRRIFGGVRLEKRSAHEFSGYSGHWGGVPVYTLPFEDECSVVLPDNSFRAITLSGDHEGNVFFSELEAPEDELNVHLSLHWGLRVATNGFRGYELRPDADVA